MFRDKLDLFYLYINPARNEPLGLKEISSYAGLYLRSFGRDILNLFRKKNPVSTRPDFKGKKIVFAVTYNNFEAIKFVLDKYENAILVCAQGFVSKTKSAIDITPLLRGSVDFRKYLFVFYLMTKKNFRLRHLKIILGSYDFVHRYRELLEGNAPECIIISNDHYPHSRALMIAAKELGIKCMYIQHASVSDVFPPMRASHALLYGKYSEDIYKKIPGSEGQFIAVGNHRFDAYREFIQEKRSTGRIGVAFNTLDPIPEVLKVCNKLAERFGKESIVLRAHPADQRKYTSPYQVSPSRQESSLEFLKGIDVLVAGNSSILLEAAAMNVYAFQLYFQPVPDYFIDYYGFIRTGVAREVANADQLVSEIAAAIKDRRFRARDATKLYDASVGQPYEFDVENHIVSVVDKILNEDSTR